MVDLVCSVCKKPALGLVTKPVNPSDQRHRKCDGAVIEIQQSMVVQKSALAAEGKEKAAERKVLTGRDHQVNHDSLTKQEVRGGSKSDRHDNGRRQNGSAGKKDDMVMQHAGGEGRTRYSTGSVSLMMNSFHSMCMPHFRRTRLGSL